MSVLYTDRLILRPFCATDAQAMFDGWTQDARVAKYCRWHPHTSLDMTEGLLAIYMDTTLLSPPLALFCPQVSLIQSWRQEFRAGDFLKVRRRERG